MYAGYFIFLQFKFMCFLLPNDLLNRTIKHGSLFRETVLLSNVGSILHVSCHLFPMFVFNTDMLGA